MEKAKTFITISGVFFLLFSFENMLGYTDQQVVSKPDPANPKSTQTKTTTTQTASKAVQTKPKTSQPVSKTVQTKPKSTQTKSTQKSSKAVTDNKIKDVGVIRIGTQNWEVANLNVSTFRNGDSIPEARTNKEWIAAGESGKPAWCYYNNDPAIGLKYGKLYNWFAVNDPRGLAPAGWTLPSDADWAKLINYLGGQGAAGGKLKNNGRWNDGNNGTNETGFTGFPGGYRVENGAFDNIGNIAIWWSSTENNTLSAIDHYLSQSNNVGRSNSPKQRGEYVRCIRE